MRFEIDPRVVFRLGEDLISDDAQAISELIKNAYDADSPWVRVQVDTREEIESLHGGERLVGCVTIEDAGTGMTSEQVEHGWLRIAVSDKRALKQAGRTTPKGRTPLGDKGLGRLGAQRLADEVELVTKASGEDALRVRFAWPDFARHDTLGRVPVDIREASRSRNGTTVRLLGMRQREYWAPGEGEQSRSRRLLSELSQIVSPYEGVRGFDITLSVDGVSLDLFSLTARLRDTAQVRYALQFDGQEMKVTGRMRLAFLQPNRKSGPEVENYQRFALHDEGGAFRRYLEERATATEWGFRKPRSKKAFVECSWTIGPDDLGELYVADGELISPGPFHGEVDGYDLGHASAAEQDVMNTTAEYRNIVKSIAGVRVYRDGFHVRTDRDPLRLSAAASSARGAYALKPDTTSGFIAISARDNAMLGEKTDREGFQDTPAFRNFTGLLQVFRAEVDSLHNEVRRAWLAYQSERLGEEAGVDDEEETEGAAERLADQLDNARALGSRVAAVNARLVAVATQSEAALEHEPDPEALAEAAEALRAVMADARAVLGETEAYLGGITAAAALPLFMGVELTELRDQIVLSQETMSLGITAEALVHELMNVCDQLESRCTALVEKVENDQLTPRLALSFADFVRASSRALRKQASHLQPGLRYVRDRRDTIDIEEFLNEIADHYATRWREQPLDIAVNVKVGFRIEMNRGKLTQILDNLLLNSEYWLREGLRKDLERGKVTIEASQPYLTISDNGPGVTPRRANRIFDPFVSGKPDGRGLGLFIVRQLLDSDGCSIYLAPDLNRRGNHSTFVLDLGGALAE